MRIDALLISLAALPLMAGAAHAQDPRAPATYGSRTLNAGFTPDPYTVNVTAGGSIQASSVGSGCSGMIAGRPDFELTYTSGSLPLIFRTAASADTTLVVNAPNGSWYCDDDSGAEGLNAEVRFDSPRSGVYDVWVGTYSGGMQPATLQVSELGGGGSPAPTDGGARPDASLAAIYGSTRLNSGFTPDPYTVNVTSGGPLQASSVGSECAGMVASAPDFELTYTAGSLPLIFRTVSDSDTTLVMTVPTGIWHCDDDGGAEGLDAEVRFDSPQSGVYDVWVGSFAGEGASAVLEISEISANTADSAPIDLSPSVIYFEHGQDGLSSHARSILTEVAQNYRAAGAMQVVLSGHTDRAGKDADNIALSQRRAQAVREYLTTLGVPEGMMTTEAFGETRNAVDTADGVREPDNNRVEITFGPGSGW